jgi:hypothetical protein
MSETKERKIISDKLLVDKTSKTLEHWFNVLDKKRARKKKLREIFKLVSGTAGLKILSEWKRNLLTTSHQWNRGLKQRGEKENGFATGVSRTVNAPVKLLYEAWVKNGTRSKWLKEKIVFRKTTPSESARITWHDGTLLKVDFYMKGNARSQVVVQHHKIADARAAAALKIFWGKKLEELKSLFKKNKAAI